jgi:hypothetical protein
VSGALLARVTAALGLEPIAERGERLMLRPHELAEFDLRGEPAPTAGSEVSSCYCVIRTGWLVDGIVVTRPLVEAGRPRP